MDSFLSYNTLWVVALECPADLNHEGSRGRRCYRMRPGASSPPNPRRLWVVRAVIRRPEPARQLLRDFRKALMGWGAELPDVTPRLRAARGNAGLGSRTRRRWLE